MRAHSLRKYLLPAGRVVERGADLFLGCVGLDDPDLPLHALPVLVPRSFFDSVVLFELAPERRLQARDLILALLELWLALLAPLLVRLVERIDPVADRVAQLGGRARHVAQFGCGRGLVLVVGRGEPARVQLGDLVDALTHSLDVILDRCNLSIPPVRQP